MRLVLLVLLRPLQLQMLMMRRMTALTMILVGIQVVKMTVLHPAAEEDRPHTPDEPAPNSDRNNSAFLLEFATLLGDGSSVTVGDALVLLMDIAIKHGFLCTAIEELLKFGFNIGVFDPITCIAPCLVLCVSSLACGLVMLERTTTLGAPTTAVEVNERLLSQKPHQCFNRPPWSIKSRKYWKAVEWESWLVYYCLPCLKSVLPAEYLVHYALLTSALHSRMKSLVTKEDVDESTVKITKFMVGTQCLNGEAQMMSNVHTLLHIPKSVLLHGPLWALSCFLFESSMGHLLKLVSSANGVPL
ncbi:hypothetical protein HPB47_014455 [Ixodes persulcatus]|uniref:Uncharacterized protein n=1 Tax=Ixodes persulcatus TaxID=34615 RepID=A0AC60QXT7_IXOPE|nr:hypothetical protein HPB47_014455 [Ixodes persulcatus]